PAQAPGAKPQKINAGGGKPRRNNRQRYLFSAHWLIVPGQSSLGPSSPSLPLVLVGPQRTGRSAQTWAQTDRHISEREARGELDAPRRAGPDGAGVADGQNLAERGRGEVHRGVAELGAIEHDKPRRSFACR